jgi:alpha-mannosidase
LERYPQYTRDRIGALSKKVQAKIYDTGKLVDELLVSPRVDRIPYAAAQQLKEWRPAKIGEQFGPLWATYWFRAKATVPKEWSGKRVDLLWDSHSEATLWIDGKSIQGLNSPERVDATILPKAKGGETIAFQIEMACNGLFGEVGTGRYRNVSPFLLDQCDIAIFDEQAFEIYHDLMVLYELEREQARDEKDLDKTWAGKLLYELNRFVNAFELDDRETWKEAGAILKPLLKVRNAPLVHELSAIGHAHIDTAWLWPLAETDRKCDRTFSSQTRYMDEYPQFKFACSQAYQYDMIQRRNPDLYERIKKKVKSGQFVPVGGTWIEPDCNIPSGESLCRQFLFGQRFFEREFGRRCNEFWNPDVFGYNGQLPQIMRQSGIGRFLTQKLSWNAFNKPIYHTFKWQGIDGSEVLTHFPPTDTYNADCEVKQLRAGARAYKENDRSRHSLMLFGFGDGGGGPTKRMLEILKRAEDLQGIPRTKIRSSDEFFELLENDNTDWPTVVGELYFELHRGTYTTQAANKRDNRQCEQLLHDVEFLSTVAMKSNSGFKYPAEEINELWKIVLLNQFHDILPGSSITLVYEDSARQYAQVLSEAAKLRDGALAALAQGGGVATPVNTTAFAREEVVANPGGALVYVQAPAYGAGRTTAPSESVQVGESGDRMVLENAQLRAEITKGGWVAALTHKASARQLLEGPVDVLLYDDNPTNWEAWDVDPSHLETGRPVAPASDAVQRDLSPLRAQLTFTRKIGRSSSIIQTIRLDAHSSRLEFYCDVDWHESRKMLKAVVPTNVRSPDATYEMQFGVAVRPTHFNTTFDIARYEVPGHRFADLSEWNFGVALLTDSKYGYATRGGTMTISLLRSPKSPDPQADMGKHHFAYAIYPHPGDWRRGEVLSQAAAFNAPLVWANGAVGTAGRSLFSLEDPDGALVLDTIKRSEDGKGVILRFYESLGGRGIAKLRVPFPFKRVTSCNVLEDEAEVVQTSGDEIIVPYSPFQIVSLKLT